MDGGTEDAESERSQSVTFTDPLIDSDPNDEEKERRCPTRENGSPLRKRIVSRRTRGTKRVHQATTLPPRGAMTEAEKEMLVKLNDLEDDSKGLKNEEAILTLVMIMREEKRPFVHFRLLEIVLNSNERILKSLSVSDQFILVLFNWLNLYSKSEAWSDVLVDVLKVLGKLPLSQADIHQVKLKIKKLSKEGMSLDVKKEAQDLFERWESKRKTPERSDPNKAPKESLPRLNSSQKRKVGRAYIAIDPDVKTRSLTRKKSGSLSVSSTGRSLSAKSSEPSSPTSKLVRMDSLSFEASAMIRKIRKDQILEEHKKTAPTELLHSMDEPPLASLHYAQQKVLYDERRAEKERQSLAPWDQCGWTMEAEIGWATPKLCHLPSGEFVRVAHQSIEKEEQTKREISIPATDSGLLFSSSLDLSRNTNLDLPVFEIPFFPCNKDQYKQQRQALLDAGIAFPVILGPNSSERVFQTSHDGLFS